MSSTLRDAVYNVESALQFLIMNMQGLQVGRAYVSYAHTMGLIFCKIRVVRVG